MDDGARLNPAGVCVVDKPAGMTSLDVIRRLKKRVAPTRMGHTGTLDPMATGVLVVCLGEATKLVPYMRLEPKKYRGSLRLGLVTDSWDVTGKILERRAVPSLSGERLLRTFSELEGLHYLEPPVFSAIKHKGRPLYAYARKGLAVESPPRETRIEAFRLLSREGDDLVFDLTCSRGTYVRAVVHALGKTLGCGACLRSLRRLQAGRFRIEDACSLEELETTLERGDPSGAFLPPAEALDHMDAYEIRGEGERKVRHGNPLRGEDVYGGESLHGHVGEKFRIMVQGELAAVAEARSDPVGVFLQPIRVIRRAA